MFTWIRNENRFIIKHVLLICHYCPDLLFTVDETDDEQKTIMLERYEKRKQFLLLQQQLSYNKTDNKDEILHMDEVITQLLFLKNGIVTKNNLIIL